MPKFTLQKLNDMYEGGKRADSALFSEQRTNILLKNGDHYTKKYNAIYSELRNKGTVSKDQKIRLTKNHIHRIVNTFENAILEGNPSVTAVPFNETELHDVKVASMNNSVLGWVRDSNSWDKKQDNFVSDFNTIGECFAKIRFDYTKGPVVAVNENGEKQRSGEFVIDRVLGFDLKRDPNSRSFDETKWWIHEQMMEVDEFKRLIEKVAPDKLNQVKPDMLKTLKIFDVNTGSYRDAKDQVLVKELYYKADDEYDDGIYCMFTDTIKVVETPIPFGIYPIVGAGFDEQTTSPRSTSIIKVCRPYQVEINRAGSKMAEHQITLGDDKVYIQKGTKLTNGGYIHGVRALQVSGKEPVIQAGRSGAQYLEYQLSQISEMYQSVDLAFILEDKQVLGDPYQLLFRTMKDKKRFVKYVTKYERFELDVFKTVLKMSKHYLGPGHVIRVMGREEAVNIPEFKKMSENGFEIKVIPQSGDVETKFGKILGVTQVLQYSSGQMTPDQIGTLIKELPFGNKSKIFSAMTLNTENAENDILAMDRGEFIPANKYDDHQFMINALINRIKKADFRFMNPEVQQMYLVKLQQHEQFFEQQKQALAQGNAGQVPMGGFLVTVNASRFNPAANRVERIKLPSDAIQWITEKIDQQGFFAQEVEGLPSASQADIAVGSLPQVGQQQIQQPGQPQEASQQNIEPQAQQ